MHAISGRAILLTTQHPREIRYKVADRCESKKSKPRQKFPTSRESSNSHSFEFGRHGSKGGTELANLQADRVRSSEFKLIRLRDSMQSFRFRNPFEGSQLKIEKYIFF